MNRIEQITELARNANMQTLCEHLYNISLQADELEDSVMLEQIDATLGLLKHNENYVSFINEQKSKTHTTLTCSVNVNQPSEAADELLDNMLYFNNYIDNIEVSITANADHLIFDVTYENSHNKVLKVYVQSVIIAFVNNFASDFLLKSEKNIQFSV